MTVISKKATPANTDLAGRQPRQSERTAADAAPRNASLPGHVAIIMDGNGRWAQVQGKPRLAGHRAGTANLRRVIEVFASYGIPYLTLYAFSTENWTRPRTEVEGLFRILSEVVDREAQFLADKGVKLRHLGTLEGLSPAMRKRVNHALAMTEHNAGMTVSIAFNYGGRAEILEAVRRIVEQGLRPEEIEETMFSQHLYTAGLPDPDLVIRTGGEVRLSNFLLWQTAYSEYYATPTFWPDFGREDIEKALHAYSQRQRRYGGLNSNHTSGAPAGD
ncbi:MAG: di-trans,poly-cis-decaprenylcistransferase [Chloroflexi bacterium]|nr:di-trans,poly-cis-decaprenylcistransferase [Chloroflexota bacterium]